MKESPIGDITNPHKLKTMDSKDRKPGWYWVKSDGQLVVAEWTGNVWYLSGDVYFFEDSNFTEISETPIPPPTEKRSMKQARPFVKIPADKATIFRIRQYAERYGMKIVKVAREDAIIVYYSDALNLYWLGANIALNPFETGTSKHV